MIQPLQRAEKIRRALARARLVRPLTERIHLAAAILGMSPLQLADRVHDVPWNYPRDSGEGK